MSDPYYSDESVTLWHGDALTVLRDLPDASVDCCVTSPPYFGLRDYGVDGQPWRPHRRSRPRISHGSRRSVTDSPTSPSGWTACAKSPASYCQLEHPGTDCQQPDLFDESV